MYKTFKKILDRVRKRDSWRVSEMECDCSNYWVAVYPSMCRHVQCPKCHSYIRTPLFIIKEDSDDRNET